MSLAISFHFLSVQHVSDINISIIRSLRLCCWITTSVVLFSVHCVLEIWCGWVWVVIQQHSRKLLMMDILMSETCWAHKWNEIASDIKLVFYSSTITTMHGPINIWLRKGIEVTLSDFRADNVSVWQRAGWSGLLHTPGWGTGIWSVSRMRLSRGYGSIRTETASLSLDNHKLQLDFSGTHPEFLWSKAVVKCPELCCVLTSAAQFYILG